MREIGSARSNARTIVRQPQAATLVSVQTDKPFRLYADRHAMKVIGQLSLEIRDPGESDGFPVFRAIPGGHKAGMLRRFTGLALDDQTASGRPNGPNTQAAGLRHL